ncbi:MAG: hybrid sensor histidine kinase/response regulator [Candidatus Methylacidiphilales bacterium]
MSSDSNLGDLSLLDLFRAEVETQASTLNNGLVNLEASAEPAVIEPLMRAAHSVKGAARIVGLDPAVEIAHRMEDVLVRAQEGQIQLPPPAIDLLLQATDILLQIGQATPESLPDLLASTAASRQSLLNALTAVRDGSTSPLTSPSPAPPQKLSEPSAAPSLDDLSMLDLFRSEVEAQTTTLNDGLVALESAPNPAEALKTLMRAAHSIKGAARIVGLDPAVELAHRMEDCLVAAQEHRIELSPEGIDLLLRAADSLAKMARQDALELPAWLTQTGQERSALLAALGQLLNGQVLAPVPPPSAPTPAPQAEIPSVSTPPSPAAAASSTSGSAVKVTAESLNRLMGLAAETLVEAKLLEPFQQSLLSLKQNRARIADLLERMRPHLEKIPGGAPELRDLWLDALSQLSRGRDTLTEIMESLEDYSRRSANLSNRLYREVIASRMRPFNDGVQGFPRLVRDLARTLGKRVKFEIVGRTTEVDRDILERLEAPLSHILRNALDHGIEPPDVRERSGKNPEASLKLEARHRAGMLLVSVVDDGRGIAAEKLRQKVIEKRLAPPEMAAALTEAELFEFLFLPGFSTAEKVTEISGRGVGLDVVQTMVHEAGGSVRIFSTLGKGTTFQIQLPITRSVVRALLTTIGGEPYAFPLARIDRALLLPATALHLVEGRPYVEVDGRNLGLVPASEILELDDPPRPADAPIHLVVISDRSSTYALEVDAFLGERDLVVRPLDPRLGKVPDVASASLMEDGSPLLILEADDLLKSIASHLSGGPLGRGRRRTPSATDQPSKTAGRVLVVDDSVTVREVERKLLESAGYEVDVATDGMEGWNAVRLASYDLVISDVDMPRMNGIEFVRRIRQDPRLKDLPVMIVSYKDREEDRLKGLEAGANYYLTKSSFHDDTLLQAVADLIAPA